MPRTSNIAPPTSTPALPRLLVVGCGNHFAGDDSVGLELLRRLESHGGYGCEFRELPEGPLGLLELFDRADIILLVDAVLSGAPPGTLHLVPMPSRDAAPRPLAAVSDHGWGLAEALRLALALGWRVPRLMLLGIELERVSVGAPSSPAVEAALTKVFECFQRICSSLHEADSPLWTTKHSFPPATGALLESL
jgi:hydrogenase maturation protease